MIILENISKKAIKELYDKDFPLWAEINAQLLKEKAFDLVDWENLIEEIEDMARRHLDSAISYLAVILEHFYKWDHFRAFTKGGRERGGIGWIKSVENARSRLKLLLKRHPSLRVELPNHLEDGWEEAIVSIEEWLRNMNLRVEDYHLPSTCPYTYEQAMNRDLSKEIMVEDSGQKTSNVSERRRKKKV